MTTFSQLQTSLNNLRYRRAILAKLGEWMDEQFLPGMDGTPKLVLLTEDKLKVPEVAFDEMSEVLNQWIKTLMSEEEKLLNSDITVVVPAAPEVEAPKEEPKETPAPIPTEELKS